MTPNSTLDRYKNILLQQTFNLIKSRDVCEFVLIVNPQRNLKGLSDNEDDEKKLNMN